MSNVLAGDFFEKMPENVKEELFDSVLKDKNVRIERIVSTGQSSPERFWYDQDENEFVTVLEGSATIEFADGEKVDLKKGSWLFIPARKKHRVDKTDETKPTVWLAVFWK